MPMRQKMKNEKEDDMKKLGILGSALIIIMIGLFVWSLSGASDNKAPTELKTIDVSPQL